MYLDHRRKSGRGGNEGRDVPNHHGIDGHRYAALGGALLPRLHERISAAGLLVIHATNEVFKAGSTVGFSMIQITHAWRLSDQGGHDQRMLGCVRRENWQRGVRAITR